MSNLIIRDARIDDADFLGKCVSMTIQSGNVSATQMARHAERENTLYSYKNALIAEIDGRNVGAVISYAGEVYPELLRNTFGRSMPQTGAREAEVDEYHIDVLAVLQDFRRQGIGRALIEKRIEWIKANYPNLRIALLVEPDNNVAQAFYRSVGFDKDAEVRVFNNPYVRMSLH